MIRKTLLPILAATAAAVVPTTVALAAGSSTTVPATASSIEVESGYAYYDSFKPRNRPLVVVVVKTKGQLPRRFDGLIRAGATLNRHGGGSIGSVGGRASRCYTFSVPLRDGRFYPVDGAAKGAKVSAGKQYLVRLSAKDADGKTISSTKTITLRDRKAGDRSGAPIGC